MNWQKEDRKIRQLFSRLRREEEKAVPTFVEVLHASRVSRPGWVLPLARDWAVVMTLLVCSAGLLLNLDRENSSGLEPTAAVFSDWQSPTDFLLFSAGERLLVTVPDLETGNWWDVGEAVDRW